MHRKKSVVYTPLTVLFIISLVFTLELSPPASFVFGKDRGDFTGSGGTGSVKEESAVENYPEKENEVKSEDAEMVMAADTYEPNDSFEEAYGPLLSGQVYQSYCSRELDNDYYYFISVSAGMFIASLESIPEGCDYDLYLYDGGMHMIDYSNNVGNDPEYLIIDSLPAGLYYLKVLDYYGYSSTEPYELLVIYTDEALPSTTWYLAEGCTAGDFETWVLVQNPGSSPVNMYMTFQTESGEVLGPQQTIPANSRISFLLNSYIETYDISTKVTANGEVVCERSMYGSCHKGIVTLDRAWGHDSIGVTDPKTTWYLAEGCTAGDFETWVLVQNPGSSPVNMNMTFQTGRGQVQGPQETIPARSRRSYRVDDYVETYDVSTKVTATGVVVCERAVYWNSWGNVYVHNGDSIEYLRREMIGRFGAHNSIGVTDPKTTWYLAEGCTAGDFETWVLVQNPGSSPVNMNMTFQTGRGQVQGPQETIPSYSRRSYRVDDYVESYDVSTKVTATGVVVCERAVYWDSGIVIEATEINGSNTISFIYVFSKGEGHNSIGVTDPKTTWYLAEGCTAGDFETWVLVQNPGSSPVNMNMTFQTGRGQVQGPQETIPARSRRSYRVDDYVETYDVSTKVTATGVVVCERAVYWNEDNHSIYEGSFWIDTFAYRVGGHDSIGYPGESP